ncbi:NAD(P)-binding domain-containing protein, partial [Bradyrhizobium sp.]
MPPSIAVVAPGAMGSAIATRLVEHGCKVLTLLKGRSAATQARAAAAGMTGASEAEIANADIILSIVPPGEAVALAEQLATLINRNAKKPVVVDCNAVNVETIRTIEDIVLSSGARLVDAAIIGLPPKPGTKGPAFYVSGDAAGDIAVLGQLGLDLRLIEGPIGAASALKMSYAGINKGLTGLGA